MRLAKVIRDVLVRGVHKRAGDVVEVSHQEFNEMHAANYVVAHEEPAAPVAPAAPEPDKKAK